MITLSALFFSRQGALLPAVMLAAMVLLGVLMTFFASWLLSRTVLRGVPSSFTLELPPFRRPRIGEVVVRSMLDRTLFVLGRAVAVAAPAGLLLWCLANLPAGEGTALLRLARGLEPLGAAIGLSGPILLAFLLGLPANELVLPILLMILSGGSAIGGAAAGETAALLTAAGWTWRTALCTMLFCLFHWPCGTTCLTIYHETKSIRWTAAAIVLPALLGAVLCALVHWLTGG